MAPGMTESSALHIKSLDKALRVLEAFGEGEQHMSLTDLVRATGLEKSAVQRIIHTLRENGYLVQDPRTRQFRLGIRVLDMSFHFLRTHPLIARATPLLIDLRRSARERVDMSLIDGTSLVYVVRLQSKRETFFATLVGRRVPIYCTAGGRAILAHLDEDAVADVLSRSNRIAFTSKTITDPDLIMDEVRVARSQGYAMQVEEVLPGEITIAAAVTDREGAPVAAIHIAGLLSEWTMDDFRMQMGPLVTSTAHALSG
jgi:DNA-binding IclR family transcriptional regulator